MRTPPEACPGQAKPPVGAISNRVGERAMLETDAYLAFFRAAGALKDTPRNSWTAARTPRERRRAQLAAGADGGGARGRACPASTTSGSCSCSSCTTSARRSAATFPAPLQGDRDKIAVERADLARLLAPLPPAAAARLAALWEECAAARDAGGPPRQGARPAGDRAFSMSRARTRRISTTPSTSATAAPRPTPIR